MKLPAGISLPGLLFRLCPWLLLPAILLYAYTGLVPFLALPFAGLYGLLLFHSPKTAYLLLLAILPFSVPVFLSGNSLSLTLPAEPMMWVFLLLAMLLWAHRPETLSWRWWRHPLVLLVVWQLFWLIPAVICSEMVLLSLKFLLAKIWVLGCFFLFPAWIFREEQDYRNALRCLLGSVLLSVLIILCRHASLGFRFSAMNEATWFIYYNHVEYATLLSMVLPLAVVAWRLTPSCRRVQRTGMLLIVLLLLLAVFFSYARAAILAVLFALAMAWALRARIAAWVMPLIYLVLILLTSYLVSGNRYIQLRPRYEQTYYHTDFSEHLSATFTGSDVSAMERLYRWTAALRMSRDRPLTGFGPNAFYYHYKPYALPSFRTYSSGNEEHSTTHNYLLHILAEQGYPAMIGYALLIAAVFACAQRSYDRFRHHRFYRSCVSGLVMMIAACFVNNLFSELIETPKIGALFYLGIALLVLLDIKSRAQPPV